MIGRRPMSDIQYPTQTIRKCSGAQSLSRKIKAFVSWILGDYWMITWTLLDDYLGYILGYSSISGYSGILGYRTVRRSVVQSQARTIHPSPNKQCGVMKQALSNICRPFGVTGSNLAGHCGVKLSDLRPKIRPNWRRAA